MHKGHKTKCAKRSRIMNLWKWRNMKLEIPIKNEKVKMRIWDIRKIQWINVEPVYRRVLIKDDEQQAFYNYKDNG